MSTHDTTPEYDSVEELKKSLNRRVAPPERVRTGFSAPFSKEGVRELREEDILEESMAPKPASRFSFISKIFAGSLVFFIAAFGVAAYLFFSGSNVFSLENIEVSVSGPVAIEGGKELTLQVAVANKNSVDLETVDFIVEYPSGTRDPADTSKSLTQTREFLDLVRPGQVINKTVRGILFGEENSEKIIKVRIEFQVPGSNATFTKEKIYSLALTSSPVGLSLAIPEETVSNEEIALDIVVGSNSDTAVRGVLVSVAYPPGFSFKSAEPAPAFQTSVWQIGDLAPGAKRTIHVVGVQEGQNDETKAFKVSVGTKSPTAEDAIGTVYTSVFKTLSIQRPRLGVQVALNSATDDTVVSSGAEPLNGIISIVNNLPDKILDPRITLVLTGASLDKTSVDAEQGGFYRSSENIVSWDKSGNPELEVLEPGAGGEFRFSFASFPPFSPSFPKGKNQDITLEITVSGTRLAPGRTAEELETVVKRRVKLATAAQLSSRLVYSTGPFKNTGPLPPRADQPTTYTVVWSVTNPSSDLTGATVEATLPQYVEWVGAISPSGEKITFNGGKVTWTIGSLKAGAGTISSAREAAFQIIFKPSIAQVNSVPVVVGGATLLGTDDFTGTEVEATQRGLTTTLTTDPAYRDGQDRVAQ